MLCAARLILWCLFFVALCARAETLARLEEIAAKAADLDAFLASPALVEEYYAAARDYYGGEAKFPKDRYLALVEQMRAVKEKVPLLKERAWETTGLGAAFSITSAAPDHGVRLDVEAWEARRKAAPSAAADWSAERLAKLWAELAATARTEEARIEGLPNRRAKDVARAALYVSLRGDARVRDAIAWMRAREEETPATKKTFGSRNADLILEHYRTLNEQPALVATRAGLPEMPSFLIGELRATIPTPKALIAQMPEAFPPRLVPGRDGNLVPAEPAPAARYEFKPLPRRFHGFFKGIANDECVGGGPRWPVADLSPERWAVSALKDSQLHYVEVGGKFEGSVHQIPLKTVGLAGHGLVASIDLGSPAFKHTVVREGPGGERTTTSLFSAWLAEAAARKPAGWTGFAVGDTSAIVNAGSLATMRISPEYLLADETHAHDKFTHLDELGKKIPGVIPLQGRGKDYGGSMIFEAGVKSVTKLTILRPRPDGLTARQWLEGRLAAGDRKSIETWIERIYLGSYDAGIGRLTEMIRAFREANVLDLLAEHKFQRFPEQAPNGLVKNARLLRESGFSWRDLVYARRIAVQGLADDVQVMKNLMPLARHADDVMGILAPDRPDPGKEWFDKTGDIVGEHAEAILKLEPTYEQLAALLKRFTGQIPRGAHRRLTTAQLARAQTVADFRAAWAWTFKDWKNESGEDLALRLEPAAAHFLGLNPDVAQTRWWFDTMRELWKVTGKGTPGETAADKISGPVGERYKKFLVEALTGAADGDAYVKLVGTTLAESSVRGDYLVVQAIEATASRVPAERLAAFAKAAGRLKPELSAKVTDAALARAQHASDVLVLGDAEFVRKHMARFRELAPTKDDWRVLRQRMGGLSYSWACVFGFGGVK